MFANKVHSKLAEDLNQQLPGDIGLTCSCSACDSIACFARRQLRKGCPCDECPRPDHTFNAKESTHSINEKISTELLKNEVTYDYEKLENNLKKDNVVDTRSQLLFGTEMAAEKDNHVKIASNQSSHPKSAAQLSAQIMNMPYEHFEESCKKSEPLLNLATLSPFDIFKKIKDVYKACSCKVCDCIVGNTQRNEFCKCKPCDCDDCKSYNLSSKVIVRSRNKDEKNACAFTRCDRPYFCRAVGKLASPKDCDCGPCECIKCVNDVSVPCNCEPCQCIECRTRNVQLLPGRRTLIVAAVGEDYQTRRPCDCVPCECIQCGRGISTTTPPILHEMSTGLNRHPRCRCDTCANDSCLPDGTDTCRCERRNKIVRKPVTNDNTDYDIRSALIHQNLHVTRNKGRDAIAMFAAVNNRYPKNDTKCKCEECECLKCNFKENAVKSMKVLRHSSRTINSNRSKSKCKCTNYVQVCPKKTKKESLLQYHTERKWCKCDMCVCLNCNKLSKSSDTEFTTEICDQSDKVDCSCAQCECTDCQREMYRCSDDLCQCTNCKCKNCVHNNLSEAANPANKGKIFIQEKVEPKLKDLFLESSINVPVDDRYYYDPTHRSSVKKLQIINSRIKTVKQSLLDVDQSQDITANARRINKGTTDLQKCLSQISAYSSASYYMRDSGSLSPLSGRRNKSWESSCNSSGHDYPNYIIKFPRHTEKSGMNDVIQFNLQSKYSPEELNTSTNTKTVKKPINISPNFWEYEKTSSSGRHFKDNEKKDKLSYDECSSIDRKILSLEFNNIPNQIRSNLMSNTKEDSKIMSTGQIDNNNSKRKLDNNRLIDYNKYFEDTKTEFYNEIYQNRSHRIRNDFLLDEDYERVQKTLEDAREFSQHLMGLLEKYEKANRDFESVSQKFKYPVNCINNNLVPNNNMIPELMQSKVLDATVGNQKDNVPTKENKFDEHFKAKDETKKNIMKNSGDEVINKFKKDKIKDLSKQKYYDYGNSDNELRLNYENSLNPIMEEKEPSPERCSIKQKIKRTKLTYNKMYKRVNVSMKPKILPNVTINCVSTETSKVFISHENYIDKEYNKQVDKEAYKMNSLENAHVDAIIERLIADRSKAAADALRPIKSYKISEDKVIRMIKPPAEMKCPILKKDSYCIQEHEPCMKEIETRHNHDSLRNKSRTITWNSDKQDIGNLQGNNTLASNSLNNLKVSHLRVRRVTNHTVMVKWDLPRALQYVDGYEILMDGRAVKKIHSASNCTAMVTCLPNVDQLLITVRTTTSYKTSVGHTPTSTIIYRPNECDEICCNLYE